MTTLYIAHAYKAKRTKRNSPKRTTPFNGYLIIPAAIHVIEKGTGNKAPIRIKNPPHLLVFFSCYAILISK